MRILCIFILCILLVDVANSAYYMPKIRWLILFLEVRVLLGRPLTAIRFDGSQGGRLSRKPVHSAHVSLLNTRQRVLLADPLIPKALRCAGGGMNRFQRDDIFLETIINLLIYS